MNEVALVIDATSLPAFQQSLRDSGHDVQGNPDYSALLSTLEPMIPRQVFHPKLAFVAVNFENPAQKKFVSYLENHLGFIVDQTDFRDAFVLPDRRSDYQRLSTRIAYVAGMLAVKKPHFVVVTDAFDVYYPLLDVVQNRGGKVSLAFFRTALEPRWERVQLFAGDSLVRFIDLDPYAKKIIGADLVSAEVPFGRKTGLGSLNIG